MLDPIPFNAPGLAHAPIQQALNAAAQRVIASGWYLQGPELKAFEQAYGQFNGTAHAVGVSSGTAAITIALQAAGLQAGEQVLVQANTCFATVTAILQAGGQPLFADVDAQSWQVSAGTLAAAHVPGCRFAVVVNMYGAAPHWSSVMAWAMAEGVTIIEDNAQAQGASSGGQLCGSWGLLSATSFYPAKNLGSLGDAGAITTNDPVLALYCQQLRDYGRTDAYTYELSGNNYRMNEMQAALLSVKLSHLNEWITERQRLYNLYLNAAAANGWAAKGVFIPALEEGVVPAPHLFVMSHPQRDGLAAYLASKGIGTGMHYPVACHQQPVLGGKYAHVQLPVCQHIAANTISLPLYPGLDVERVVGGVGGGLNCTVLK